MSFLKKGKVSSAIPSFSTEDVVPAGVTWPFSGAVAPTGYLICDGSAISRTTYARLFAVIGTTYGIGDGSTTFNIPNTQGVFLRGAGSQVVNGRTKGGNSVGSITEDAEQNATGYFGFTDDNDAGMRVRVREATGIFSSQTISDNYVNSNGVPGTVSVGGRVHIDLSDQQRTASEVYPTNLAMNYIIKF